MSETPRSTGAAGRRGADLGLAFAARAEARPEDLAIGVAPAALDEEILSEIEDLLGAERVALASSLADELDRRFTDPTDRDRSRQEAHMTVSAAGALGLMRLSDAARALETACFDGLDFTSPLLECRDARDEANVILSMRFKSCRALQTT